MDILIDLILNESLFFQSKLLFEFLNFQVHLSVQLFVFEFPLSALYFYSNFLFDRTTGVEFSDFSFKNLAGSLELKDFILTLFIHFLIPFVFESCLILDFHFVPLRLPFVAFLLNDLELAV
jgi:hypothetical protein